MSPLVDKLDQQRHLQRIDRNACRRCATAKTALNHDVTIIHFKLSLEEGGVRRVSDRDEYAANINGLVCVSLGRADLHASDTHVVAQNLGKRVIPYHMDILFRHDTVTQYFLAPELVPPVH